MSTAAAVMPALVRPDAAPIAALRQLLDQLEDVLQDVPSEVYAARPAPRVSGTVGQHLRHCLDHVEALLSARAAAFLSYDHRDRGTAVETDRAAALERLADLRELLDRWSRTRSLDEPVQVISQVSTDGEVVVAWSTLAREMAFVISHTIHHQATMAVLLEMCGWRVPERFGRAPSTPPGPEAPAPIRTRQPTVPCAR